MLHRTFLVMHMDVNVLTELYAIVKQKTETFHPQGGEETREASRGGAVRRSSEEEPREGVQGRG